MITFESTGSFKNIEDFIKRMLKMDIFTVMSQGGRDGVAALASATPVDSGLTAASWSYEINNTTDSYSITWLNTRMDGAGNPVAILLQYGHGTGTGGYVQGTDYINPAIRPIFDKIAESVWKVVTSA